MPPVHGLPYIIVGEMVIRLIAFIPPSHTTAICPVRLYFFFIFEEIVALRNRQNGILKPSDIWLIPFKRPLEILKGTKSTKRDCGLYLGV